MKIFTLASATRKVHSFHRESFRDNVYSVEYIPQNIEITSDECLQKYVFLKNKWNKYFIGKTSKILNFRYVLKYIFWYGFKKR